MKKFLNLLKLFVFNTIFILILFLIFDFVVFLKSVDTKNIDASTIYMGYVEQHKLISFEDYFKMLEKENYFRHYLIPKSKKRPVIIFGCSFAYGFLLKDEESFSYQLAKCTNRSVYNFGISSTGFQHIIAILDNYDMKKNIANPEYVFIVIIDDHFRRLYRATFGIFEPIKDVNYKLANNHLVYFSKKHFWYNFPFGRMIDEYITAKKVGYINDKDTIDFGYAHFNLIYSKIKQIYPDTKIVIIPYIYDEEDRYLNQIEWSKLEKTGYTVLSTKSLIGRIFNKPEDFSIDKMHPSGKAWHLIVQNLTEKLHL